jgi:predicted lipoprotein with Yx(FWY)xxD motif
MQSTISFTALGAAVLIGSALAAHAAGMLADPKGMTLYSYDKDAGGVSTCYDACAAKWPPYLGKAGDAMTAGWTLVERSDGSKQWAYDGKPMYYFAGDKKKGEAKGDGMGGVWHVIKE